MKQFKIVCLPCPLFSLSTLILLVNTLVMFLMSGPTAESADGTIADQEDHELRNASLAQNIQYWCEKASQAKDEGELQAVDFRLDHAQAEQIKWMKSAYEEWQKYKAKAEEQNAKVQELTAQVSAEHVKLDAGNRIPTPKEKELETAIYGVKQEIMELSGLMRKIHDLNSALEASQRAGSVGQFDDRSLQE